MPPPDKGASVVADFFKGGGGKASPPPMKDEPDGDEGGDTGESGMDDPAYSSAFQDYQDNPSKETFWRAVKACMEAY